MKGILMSAAFTGLIAVGSYAGAQSSQSTQSGQSSQSGQSMQSEPSSNSYSNNDSNSANGANKTETMKQCMARQKATNSGLTHEAMRTTCKNEMKQQKEHREGNDLATGPQSSQGENQSQGHPQQ